MMIAVVTGGSKGLGFQITRDLIEEGYKVYVLDKAQLDNKYHSENLVFLECDVTLSEEVEKSISTIILLNNRIDVLINNAGGSLGIKGELESIDNKDWINSINLNMNSIFYTTKAVVPIMKKRLYGRIINISSLAGRSRSVFGTTPYATAKAGVIGFTRQASKELGQFGITINAIAPGTILSGERIKAYWENLEQEKKDKHISQLAIPRIGVPSDITSAVLFLCNKKSSYITGTVIDVNGGAWVG